MRILVARPGIVDYTGKTGRNRDFTRTFCVFDIGRVSVESPPTDNANREFSRIYSVWSSLSGSDRRCEQRILADVLCVVVPFGLRQAIRTENSRGYALCGRPFRTPTGDTNREFSRICSVWSSLSTSDKSIRTENSRGYALCGRSFRAPTDNANREFSRIYSVWSFLSGSDRRYEQRILADMLCVVVPFGLRQAIRTENSRGYALCGRPFRTPMKRPVLQVKPTESNILPAYIAFQLYISCRLIICSNE